MGTAWATVIGGALTALIGAFATNFAMMSPAHRRMRTFEKLIELEKSAPDDEVRANLRDAIEIVSLEIRIDAGVASKGDYRLVAMTAPVALLMLLGGVLYLLAPNDGMGPPVDLYEKFPAIVLILYGVLFIAAAAVMQWRRNTRRRDEEKNQLQEQREEAKLAPKRRRVRRQAAYAERLARQRDEAHPAEEHDPGLSTTRSPVEESEDVEPAAANVER